MFNCSDYKIWVGIVTGALFWTMTTVTIALEAETYHLLDSQGQPVKTTRPAECVETPQSPNAPSQSFIECGDSRSKNVFGEPQPDSDNDGVPDSRSDCPYNTFLEISKGVDSRGCPLDSDQDRVPNYQDSCPGTSYGVAVDAKGCAIVNTPNRPVVLSGDVLFAFDQSVLTYQAKTTLKNLINQSGVGFIESIRVVGHTDSIGQESYNQRLSEERARSVSNYLISIGIATGQISYHGNGERNPIASNATKIGRAQNRRVEIIITEYRKR
jgi:OOP family OmpA-OmpF porin